MRDLGRMIASAINNREDSGTLAALHEEVRQICARFPVPGLPES
jgi:glycine/serine hydroxymethyltransferase